MSYHTIVFSDISLEEKRNVGRKHPVSRDPFGRPLGSGRRVSHPGAQLQPPSPQAVKKSQLHLSEQPVSHLQRQQPRLWHGPRGCLIAHQVDVAAYLRLTEQVFFCFIACAMALCSRGPAPAERPGSLPAPAPPTERLKPHSRLPRASGFLPSEVERRK